MAVYMPVLFCSGTHYEVGYRMGVTFKNNINEYYKLFGDLHEKFLPFYQTAEGRQICEDYHEVIKESYPQYLQEMQGIADGADLPFEQVLLMHIRVELQTYLGKTDVPECSTVFVNSEQTICLSHNEDTSFLVRNRCYLVAAHIVEAQPQGKQKISEERFTSLCYPGVIPGNSMNFNTHGLVVTVNALYPSLMRLKRTPRQIINRAALSAKNISMLKEILTDEGVGIATGCSVNVGSVKSAQKLTMFNFELAPCEDKEKSVVSEFVVEADADKQGGYYYHFNMYKHLSIPEMPGRTTSSTHRQHRADQLPIPKDVEGSLLILGDTEDKEYPIYRTPSSTDQGDTVATGVFDLRQARFTVYVGNPKLNDPVLELPLMFSQ